MSENGCLKKRCWPGTAYIAALTVGLADVLATGRDLRCLNVAEGFSRSDGTSLFGLRVPVRTGDGVQRRGEQVDIPPFRSTGKHTTVDPIPMSHIDSGVTRLPIGDHHPIKSQNLVVAARIRPMAYLAASAPPEGAKPDPGIRDASGFGCRSSSKRGLPCGC